MKTLPLFLAVFLVALPAAAGDDWETVLSSPIVVKTRLREGSAVKEVWAEGVIDAPVQDIQAALMDPARFPKFMPYVKEARVVGQPEPDGANIVYTRLDLPLVSPRDYVLRVYLDQGTLPDGTGEFREHWEATNKLPARYGIVRLTTNNGGWHVTPQADGKSWAEYKFNVNPGGWIPAFAADLGNKDGVSDTWKAVEKEAQRRANERKAHAAK